MEFIKKYIPRLTGISCYTDSQNTWMSLFQHGAISTGCAGNAVNNTLSENVWDIGLCTPVLRKVRQGERDSLLALFSMAKGIVDCLEIPFIP